MAADFALRVNFQPDNVPVPDYHRADTGAVYGLRTNGYTYGWNALNKANARDRDSSLSYDQRYDTFNHMQKNGNFAWEIAVPNGQYKVRLVGGDASYVDSVMKINIEGSLAVNGTPTKSNPWVEGTVTVNVADGKLTVSNAAGAVNNKICFIEIGESMITATPTPNPTTPLGTLKWKSAAYHMPRTELMKAVVNDKLYLLGGYINNKYLSVARMDVYDPANNTWAQLPDMPVKISHAGVAYDSRYIYMAGGYTVNAAGTKQVFGMKNAYRFDTQTNKWETLPSLPVYRGAGSMVLVGRTLYYMGGFDQNMGDQSGIYTLNLDNLSAGWAQKGNMPGANNHFALILLNNKVYSIGGQTGNDATAVFKNSVFSYDPATAKWTQLASFGSPNRSHIATTTVVYKGKIIMMGGESMGAEINRPRTVQAVEAYDPASNKWSILTKLPGARSGGVAGVFGDKIVFSTGLSSGIYMGETWIGEFA